MDTATTRTVLPADVLPDALHPDDIGALPRAPRPPRPLAHGAVPAS
ncbi:hypothetical protein AB0E88_15420 [Streptomyces sp. NPDC028635]